MKKKFLLSLMACLMLGTSLTLVACGDDGGKVNSYEGFQSAISTYLDDATLFKEGTTVGNIQTDFYFDNFSYKNSSGNLVEGDKNYLTLNAYSMNYIQEYHVLLGSLADGKYNFKALNNALANLNESFEAVKVESKNVFNANTNANIDIYNGFFANYKDKAKDFIDSGYATAIELSNFLVDQADMFDGLGTDSQTSEQIEFYMDTQILYIFNDIRIMLLDSSEGQELIGNELYDGVVRQLSYYANTSTRHVADITAEVMGDLMDLTTHLAGEREYTITAAENFSLYSFVKVYASSIESYMQDDVNAQSYYEQLKKYYSNTKSYLNLYHTNIENYIYE